MSKPLQSTEDGVDEVAMETYRALQSSHVITYIDLDCKFIPLILVLLDVYEEE